MDILQYSISRYNAEDEPALDAGLRLTDRLALRSFLMDGIDLTSFPPPKNGSYNGMSAAMFEGFIQSIETHIFLYAICMSGSYNARSISTLVSENFFGFLSDMEGSGTGMAQSIAIPRLMSKVTEVMHIRMNPQNR